MNCKYTNGFLIVLLTTIVGCRGDESEVNDEKYYFFSEDQFINIIDDNRLRIDKPGNEELNFVISYLDAQKWSLFRDKNIVDSLFNEDVGKEIIRDYFKFSDSLEILEIKRTIEDKSELFGLTAPMLSNINKIFTSEYATLKNRECIKCKDRCLDFSAIENI